MSVVIPSLRAAIAVPGWAKNELWRKARAVPSLDLRFADNKSLTDATTGSNLVTFTRASSGTYTDSAGVLQTATTDVPRFDHNPTTGESLGLLLEEQRTNLQTFSEEFNNAAYGASAGSVSGVNAGIAPNGTSTADEITSTGGGIFRSLTVVTATVYTASVYAKYVSGGTGFSFGCDSGPANGRTVFNLQTGVVTSNGANVTSSSIADAGNGWYRCTVTFTSTSTSIVLVYYNGTSGSKYLVWGAQLEAGAFPTSYIPTTTAAATRSADVASITGSAFSSWYRQDEGTVFAECAVAQPATGGNQFVFRANDNSFSNNTTLNIQGSGFASIATAAGGVFDGAAAGVLALSANTTAKLAGAYAANNLGVSLNGATAVTDTSATMPTALTRADIGSDHSGANRVKAGTIKRLTYWPQRLANSTLQTLTR